MFWRSKVRMPQMAMILGFALSLFMGTCTSAFASAAPVASVQYSSVMGSHIVSTAKSFEGRVTYSFGVRNPQLLIFDCSSFTQYVFKLNGISLPWSSRLQSHMGSYVSKSNLRPGDLVFFSVSTPGQVNHVGIYIGNGQFINNLPHSGVVVSNLNSTYWRHHYITGRRV